MSKSIRWQRQCLFPSTCLAGLLFFLIFSHDQERVSLNQFEAPTSTYTKTTELPCHSLPGANETVVVLRTGSTEITDKLPVHLSTTLKCYPNHLIFSDHDENFHGETVIDALASVSADILETNPDFELHRRLRRSGRSTLEASELSGVDSEVVMVAGKIANPGWKLDKWKFMPMIERAFREYPEMKWFVFVEADSYIFWRSTLQYLSQLDHTKHHYSGSGTYIGDDLFAYGGSGFFVSQAAMRTVVNYYTAHQKDIEDATAKHWAGDCVLGNVFKAAGVKFTNSYPILQGHHPGTVPYAKPDGRSSEDDPMRLWCYPSVSYHHVTPKVVEDLWGFEQQWFASDQRVRDPPLLTITARLTILIQNHTTILRHKDVFHSYILPKMAAPDSGSGWDNESDDDKGIMSSIDDCKARCEGDMQCKQYSFDGEGRCKTRGSPRLGKAAADVQSGWLPDRMERFEQRDMAPCGDEGWIT